LRHTQAGVNAAGGAHQPACVLLARSAPGSTAVGSSKRCDAKYCAQAV
jgi:hypothetical protein